MKKIKDIKIVVTGILKDKDLFLVVKRSENDNLYPGAWEFPGGHLEVGETLKQALVRELKKEIGFNEDFDPIITNYTDEIINKEGKLIHNLEIDFIIEVNKNDLNIKLNNEHSDYKWVSKDSILLDEYIKSKLVNL